MNGESSSGGYAKNDIHHLKVPIGVNGSCVMRSPVAEPNRSVDTIKIAALSRQPGNPRLTDNPCILKNVYGKYRSKSISTNQHQQQTQSSSGKEHS